MTATITLSRACGKCLDVAITRCTPVAVHCCTAVYMQRAFDCLFKP